MASENDKSTAEHAVLAQWHAKRKMSKTPRETQVFQGCAFIRAMLVLSKNVRNRLKKHDSPRDAFQKRFLLDFGSLGDPFGTSGGLPGGVWNLLAALGAPLGGLLGALGTLSVSYTHLTLPTNREV